MISPLPRAKRARNPRQTEGDESASAKPAVHDDDEPQVAPAQEAPAEESQKPGPEEPEPGSFANAPFAQLEIK